MTVYISILIILSPQKEHYVFNCTNIQTYVSSLGCTTGVIRLVGSNYTYQGRVEICVNNIWGTVCDDASDSSDAQVVCRQQGYSSGNIYE